MTCWYSDDITTAASKLEFCSGALLATSVLAPQHWTLLLIATLIWNSQPCPIKVPHRVIQGLFLINNLHLQCIQSGTAQYYWAYPHMSAGPRCISFKVVSRTVKTRVRKTKFYMALIKTWLSLHQILYFAVSAGQCPPFCCDSIDSMRSHTASGGSYSCHGTGEGRRLQQLLLCNWAAAKTDTHLNLTYNSISYTGTRGEEKKKGGKGLGPVNFSHRWNFVSSLH